MAYSNYIKEEELKNKVANDFFNNFDHTKIIGNIDFCIAAQRQHDNELHSFLWAEAKKGNKCDIYESFVQLILTIGKAKISEKFMPPSFIGAFDAEKIAFIQYHIISKIFFENDFNWNVTPSNHETKEFKHLYKLVKESLEYNLLLFKFGNDDNLLKKFISDNFVYGKNFSKFDITKNNFTTVYLHWMKEVKPTISNVDWDEVKQYGILDADFYLADILSNDNVTIKDKLYVLLKNNTYEYDEHFHKGRLFVSRASFNDGQKAHAQFWNKYNRPPREEFWNYILERRDLLVPQDIRERKGSYFTPQCWVELSQNIWLIILATTGRKNIMSGIVPPAPVIFLLD
ncbi:MAG: hypothetical protein PUB01_03545 [Desulfovibrionaceae bacterium]|nr:hypothetical protein [Desulfovibrionaceae bacterium]